MRITRSSNIGSHLACLVRAPEIEAQVDSDLKSCGEVVSDIFKVLDMGMVKTASHGDLLDELSKRYQVQINILGQNKKASSEDSDSDSDPDSKTKIVQFPAIVNNNDPDYICTVSMSRPQEGIVAVSVYLMETTLGQYAYKNNFFFREKNEVFAKRTFRRIHSLIKDIREDVSAGFKIQHEVPIMIAKKLQGEEGEVQQDSKKFAVYLDPNNVAKMDGGAKNFSYLKDQSSILPIKR